MNKIVVIGAAIAVIAIGAGIYATRGSHSASAPLSAGQIATSTEGRECRQDGKVCPDGSVVGRTGPACEFSACPPANATSTTITTYMGGTATGLNVSVSPKQVVSDSRCPSGVQCIWAGTVEVRTVLATAVAHGEHVLTLNKPQTFGDYTVTLVGVSPVKTQEPIASSSYRFTYRIEKR